MYKTVVKIAAAAMLATMVIGCGGNQEQQNQASAASLMSINRGVDSAYVQLKQSYETFQAAEMDNALEGLNKYLASVSQTLGSMSVPNDCKPLQKAIADKVETLRSIAANESKEQVRIYKIPDTDFTDELRAEWDNISARVDKKVSDANSKVTDISNKIKKNQQTK